MGWGRDTSFSCHPQDCGKLLVLNLHFPHFLNPTFLSSHVALDKLGVLTGCATRKW